MPKAIKESENLTEKAIKESENLTENPTENFAKKMRYQQNSMKNLNQIITRRGAKRIQSKINQKI